VESTFLGSAVLPRPALETAQLLRRTVDATSVPSFMWIKRFLGAVSD
jgi:hypothetical protein